MIGAHFYYRHFNIVFDRKQSKRNADVVIQIALCGLGFVMLG